VIINQALAGDGRIRGFRPDIAGLLAYLIAHDAHHRGQITMLARQIGHPLPRKPCSAWGSGLAVINKNHALIEIGA
jgi:DinB family